MRQSIASDKIAGDRIAGSRPVSWLLKLWSPQGIEARTAREFALIYIILAVLGYINFLRTITIVSTYVYNISLSLGILVAMWLFTSRYINVIPQGVSVLARVLAICLILVLAMMGALGWLISPVYISAYHPAIDDHQTLRFTPNSSGGYDVAEVDFSFETELGERLQSLASEYETFYRKTDFTFPFNGQTYCACLCWMATRPPGASRPHRRGRLRL